MGGRDARRRAARGRRRAQLLGGTARPRGPRADGRLPGRLADPGRGRSPRGRLLGHRGVDGPGLTRRPGAAPRPHVHRLGPRHRRARARRHRGPAHAGCVPHRGAPAHGRQALRLRVHAPGQLGLAAPRRLKPDQPARLRGQPALVHALRGADGAALAGCAGRRVARLPALLRLGPAPVGGDAPGRRRRAGDPPLCPHRARLDAGRVRSELGRGRCPGVVRGGRRGGDHGARPGPGPWRGPPSRGSSSSCSGSG